jgi:hypothetical protein
MRTVLVAWLILGIAAPAFAGDLQQSVAKAAADQARQVERAPAQAKSKPMIYTGAAMFVGGMALGLYSFINNQNGSYAEFGEANAVNKPLGATGLAIAFGGGALIFLGNHRGAKQAPSVSVGPGGVQVSKRLTW